MGPPGDIFTPRVAPPAGVRVSVFRGTVGVRLGHGTGVLALLLLPPLRQLPSAVPALAVDAAARAVTLPDRGTAAPLLAAAVSPLTPAWEWACVDTCSGGVGDGHASAGID